MFLAICHEIKNMFSAGTLIICHNVIYVQYVSKAFGRLCRRRPRRQLRLGAEGASRGRGDLGTDPRGAGKGKVQKMGSFM